MSDYPMLQEMPQDIESIDWHKLNDSSENEELYRKLNTSKYKKHILTAFDKAEIFQQGSQYFCLDARMKQITYYMKYEVKNNGKLGSYVWQSLVWTYPAASYISGVPQKMFFEYLLPKFGTIIADSQQTWDGKRFWRLRLAEAFQKKLNVYFYDFSNHAIEKIDDYKHFEECDKRRGIWGPSDLNQMKRMVISNKDLSLTKGS
jgi:hypothetical protein